MTHSHPSAAPVAVPLGRHHDTACADHDVHESAFDYWQKTCASSHERPIALIKTDVHDIFGCLDEMAVALKTGQAQADDCLCTKLATSGDELDALHHEIREVYQRSVEQWQLSMKKLRFQSQCA